MKLYLGTKKSKYHIRAIYDGTKTICTEHSSKLRWSNIVESNDIEVYIKNHPDQRMKVPSNYVEYTYLQQWSDNNDHIIMSDDDILNILSSQYEKNNTLDKLSHIKEINRYILSDNENLYTSLHSSNMTKWIIFVCIIVLISGILMQR
jgi:hypothetical protein